GVFKYSMPVNAHIFEFLKTYLYGIHKKVLKNEELEVLFFHALKNDIAPVISQYTISYEDENGLAKIDDWFIHSKIKYKNENYFISLVIVKDMDRIIYNFNVLGESLSDVNPKKLAEVLIEESIKNSIYNGKILKLISKPRSFMPDLDEESPDSLEFEIIKSLNNTAMEDIILPQEIKEKLNIFVKAVLRYNEIRKPLRYILSGLPGSGKTKIVKGIANACAGKATIILTNAGNLPLNMLFSFANMFEPCIICIDDLDIAIRERHETHPRMLSSFLEHLDGFIKNNVFLLATVNNKRILDFAASRPGRFDYIIDLETLTKKDYFEIVKLNTKDEKILELFKNDDVLDALVAKKAVGAFLVNLIKQIELIKKLNSGADFSAKDLLNLIKQNYESFYKDKGKSDIGFYSEDL
ncbi:MAG: AAA family ATPase, partial [Elusimicrobiales bacterium]